MKPILVSAMLCATCSGEKVRFTPRASSTSALPDEEEALRLPCLATFTPTEAATNMEAAEILKVLEPSPPVPHISSSSSGLRSEERRVGQESSHIGSQW